MTRPATLGAAVLLLAGCGTAAPHPSSGTAPAPEPSPGVPSEASLDAFMETLAAAGFSGAAYVELAGSELVAGGFGGMSGGFGGGSDGADADAFTDSTLFYLASLSKQFTGAAALAASEAGCLDLEGTVGRYLPRAGEEIGAISIESLLAHTSGLPEYHAGVDEHIDRDEAVTRILGSELSPDAGTYAYSNAAYSLLAAIIERSCGAAFGDFLRELLLEPAGLSDTFVLGESPRVGLEGARGYVDGADRGVPANWTGPAWAHLGSGGVVSTLRDMVRWARQLRDCTVLSARSCRRWVEPLVETRAGWYAYGWRVTDTDYGGRLIYHFGSEDNGHNAALMWFPERGCLVIVLSNVQADDSSFAAPTAVSLARRVLDPTYDGLPSYAQPE